MALINEEGIAFVILFPMGVNDQRHLSHFSYEKLGRYTHTKHVRTGNRTRVNREPREYSRGFPGEGRQTTVR